MKEIFVTFQCKRAYKIVNNHPLFKTYRYAIKCDNFKLAQDSLYDINGYEGYKYLRLNYSGKLNKNNLIILTPKKCGNSIQYYKKNGQIW